eukprot:Hpha_TRINITY_DN15915_c5_g7::TRINITY_DN15915_c5_g7_i1::g.73270::m.73270
MQQGFVDDPCGGVIPNNWVAGAPPQHLTFRVDAEFARRMRYCGWEVFGDRPSNPSLAVWEVGVEGQPLVTAAQCAATPGQGLQLWPIPEHICSSQSPSSTVVFRFRVLRCFGRDAGIRVDRLLLLDGCAAPNHLSPAPSPCRHRHGESHWGNSTGESGNTIAAGDMSMGGLSPPHQTRRPRPIPTFGGLPNWEEEVAVPPRAANLYEALESLSNDVRRLRPMGRPSPVSPARLRSRTPRPSATSAPGWDATSGGGGREMSSAVSDIREALAALERDIRVDSSTRPRP